MSNEKQLTLNALKNLRMKRTMLDEQEEDLIAFARQREATWAEIGSIYEVTRQAAHARWHYLENRNA